MDSVTILAVKDKHIDIFKLYNHQNRTHLKMQF